MRDRFLALAPVLIGVLIGVWAQYASEGIVFLIFCALGGGGWLAYRTGRSLLPKRPRWAIWVYQFGVTLPVLVVAIVSTISTWLALSLEPLLTGSTNAALASDAKVVSGVLIGAIGAFLSGMWLDEAENPKSGLWPAKNAKTGFSEVFGHIAEDLQGETRINVADAVFEDRVAAGDIQGWSLEAMRKRLDVILDHYAP